MTIQYRAGGTLLDADRVWFINPDGTRGTAGFTTAAYRGEIGTCDVLIDDPDGDLTLTGLTPFTVDETACDPTRVWTGYVTERAISRDDKAQNSVACVHHCTLVDQNILLGAKLNRFIDNTAKRGAETDVERVAWLLTSRALAGYVFDLGLVSTANPGAFLEADCRRKHALPVLQELAPSAVKNFFVYRDLTSGSAGLYYGKDTSTAYASLARITNDGTADNDGVFTPTVDAQLLRQPHEVATGVDYGWRGDPIWVSSATTAAAFGLDLEFVYDTDRIGRLATAQQAAKDWLNVRSTETDRVTVTCVVKASRVNWIYAGHRLQVKFTHLPGFTSTVWTRVRRRTATPVAPGFWELKLELWVPSVPVTDAAISASGECPAIVQSVTEPYTGAGNASLTFPAPVTAGNHLVAIIARRGAFSASILVPTLPAGLGSLNRTFTAFGTSVDTPNATIANLTIAWRVATGDEQTLEWNSDSQLHVTLYEISGMDADPSVLATVARADAQSAGSTFSLGTIGSAGSLNLIGYIWNRDFEDTDYYTLGAGWTVDSSDSSDSGRPYVEKGHSSGSIAATATASISVEWAGFAVALTSAACSVADPLPMAGDPIAYEVSPTTPNGSTVLYSTSNPYADGTLQVFVDGIRLVDADVTETSPEAGTYTLAFAPESDEIVETSYEVR